MADDEMANQIYRRKYRKVEKRREDEKTSKEEKMSAWDRSSRMEKIRRITEKMIRERNMQNQTDSEQEAGERRAKTDADDEVNTRIKTNMSNV